MYETRIQKTSTKWGTGRRAGARTPADQLITKCVFIYQGGEKNIIQAKKNINDTKKSSSSLVTGLEWSRGFQEVNPLNAELNPTCHLLALLGAHHILHVSRIRIKVPRFHDNGTGWW
jgi:hypothetical protein